MLQERQSVNHPLRSKPSVDHALSYASSNVDYSIGDNIYMLPSDINLNIRQGTVGYNNKILVSEGNFLKIL